MHWLKYDLSNVNANNLDSFNFKQIRGNNAASMIAICFSIDLVLLWGEWNTIHMPILHYLNACEIDSIATTQTIIDWSEPETDDE